SAAGYSACNYLGMKNKITTIVIVLIVQLFMSCDNPTSKPENTPSGTNSEKIALKLLYDGIKNKSAIRQDDEISIGDTLIKLRIDVEHIGQKDDKWIYAANFFTTYKTTVETGISVGSVGIGKTKDEA